MSTQVLERGSHREAPSRSHRSPVVLVAETDPLMRRLIAIALRRDGFGVLTANDGAELDKWIRRLIARERDHRFVDLIIADQRMPTATGLEVLARLRHADWSTPFILITAIGDTVTHVEAERLGATCVIDKPYALDDLRAAAFRFAMPRTHDYTRGDRRR